MKVHGTFLDPASPLVPLLPDLPMETRDLNLLYQGRKLQSPAIKRFVETTLEVFNQAGGVGKMW